MEQLLLSVLSDIDAAMGVGKYFFSTDKVHNLHIFRVGTNDNAYLLHGKQYLDDNTNIGISTNQGYVSIDVYTKNKSIDIKRIGLNMGLFPENTLWNYL